MPVPDLVALRRTFLAAGTANPFVDRTILELADHFEDLVDAGCADGLKRSDAEQRALATLGELDVLEQAVRRQPALKSWAWNWPRVASVFYPLAWLVALPMLPVAAGVAHAPEIARWAGGIVLAAFVTATMFLVLQLSIASA